MTDKNIEEKKEEKKEAAPVNPNLDMAAAIAAAVKMTLDESRRIAVDAAAEKHVPKPPREHRKCQDCGQALKGCEGKHTKMVVYPKRYPEFGKWFAGAIINNVTYLSNDDTHEVLVPVGCVDGITKLIADFETSAHQTQVGRNNASARRMNSAGIVTSSPAQNLFR